MKNVHVGWGPVGMTRILLKENTKLKLSDTLITLELNQTHQLIINSEYEETPVWKSSNENVITVDQNGLVTVVGYGVAQITVTSGDLKGSCTISVPKPQEPEIPDTPEIPDEPENKLDNTKMYYGSMPYLDEITTFSDITEEMLLNAYQQGQLQEKDYEPTEFQLVVPDSELAIVLLPNQTYIAKKNVLGTFEEFSCSAGSEYCANNLKVGDFYLYGELNISNEATILVSIS